MGDRLTVHPGTDWVLTCSIDPIPAIRAAYTRARSENVTAPSKHAAVTVELDGTADDLSRLCEDVVEAFAALAALDAEGGSADARCLTVYPTDGTSWEVPVTYGVLHTADALAKQLADL